MLANILVGVGAGLGIMEIREAHKTRKANKRIQELNRSMKNEKAKALAQEWYLKRALREAEENLKKVSVI